MSTDQRSKARSLLASEGYAKGGKPRMPTHMPHPRFQRPTAPGPATMPQGAPTMQAPSLGAAPGVPGSPPAFKKGGKVKNDHDADDKPGYAKGGKAKPRHFAQGGAAKVRKDVASTDGKPQPAKVKFKAKAGIGGGK